MAVPETNDVMVALRVTLCPKFDGLGAAVSAVVLLAGLTVKLTVLELDPPKSVSPE